MKKLKKELALLSFFGGYFWVLFAFYICEKLFNIPQSKLPSWISKIFSYISKFSVNTLITFLGTAVTIRVTSLINKDLEESFTINKNRYE